MYGRAIACVAIVIAGGVAAIAAPWRAGLRRDPRTLDGWALYDRYCLACHGASGDGHGPAAPYTWGRPRSFVRGEYAWRTTPIGQPPTDDDLRTTIRHGASGTSMPGFADVLSPAEIDRLVAVVTAFEPARATTTPPLVTLAAPPAVALARGAERWTQLGCVACHGDAGKGDGPSAKALADPPYDLTTNPLRRPRDGDDRDARRRAAALSIATGMTGTAMPGYGGVIPDADVWALADHVVELGMTATRRDRSALDGDTIDDDAATPIANGTWPGSDPDDAAVWGTLVAPQGTPPASLAPAQASLHALQCARCHAKQYREWQGSVHAGAMSPGFFAQTADLPPKELASCRKCHAPLAEQATDVRLAAESVQCAGCHVRGWTRRGPPNVSPTLLAVSSYPLVTLPIYERADFCLPCHQLAPRNALEGKPLLNTYKEWLEGPYMRRGVQCQHCHMPNREHQFRGIHDPQTVREGIALTGTGRRHVDHGKAAVTVVAELRNIGAGHYLPTTPTPAIWLNLELVDARGAPIRGAAAEYRIGRDIEFTPAGWVERADTRIPPGERVDVVRAWSGGRTSEAANARITIRVAPDDYYERLYKQKLAGTVAPARRALYEAALARARASAYVAEQQLVPLR